MNQWIALIKKIEITKREKRKWAVCWSFSNEVALRE